MKQLIGASKIVVIIELFALALVIAVVIFMIQSRQSSQTNSNIDNTQNPAINSTTNIVINGVPQEQPAIPDDDGDGISNDKEASLGTNPQSADSDNDALSDYDEVEVFKSDPLKADTDGDGNADGAEVDNGYSPTDDTKLLDFERERDKLNQQ